MVDCIYCGCRTYRHRMPHKSLKKTRDHIFPKSKFPLYMGKHGNIAISCQGCNVKKGDMHPFRWAEMLDDRGFRLLLRRFYKMGLPPVCIIGMRKQRLERLSNDTSNR